MFLYSEHLNQYGEVLAKILTNTGVLHVLCVPYIAYIYVTIYNTSKLYVYTGLQFF